MTYLMMNWASYQQNIQMLYLSKRSNCFFLSFLFFFVGGLSATEDRSSIYFNLRGPEGVHSIVGFCGDKNFTIHFLGENHKCKVIVPSKITNVQVNGVKIIVSMEGGKKATLDLKNPPRHMSGYDFLYGFVGWLYPFKNSEKLEQ